jgi:hypothetical protein
LALGLSLPLGGLGGFPFLGQFRLVLLLLEFPGLLFLGQTLLIGTDSALKVYKFLVAGFEMSGELLLLALQSGAMLFQSDFVFGQGGLLGRDSCHLNAQRFPFLEDGLIVDWRTT